jgi:hypothetical protein
MTASACLRAVLASAWIAAACGCLAQSDPASAIAGPGSDPVVPARDTAQARRLDSLLRANDSLRARARLVRLAADVPRLPVPIGTRYFAAPAPAAKAAAAQACRGGMDVFALEHSARGVLGIDTVAYYDTAGATHCVQQAPTARETHARYVMDPSSGEAWERMEISITEDDAFPRYRTRGTGTIHLNSGVALAIVDYSIDMALDNATRTPIWFDAGLTLATADGLRIRLAMTAPRPIRAQDFFPIWQDAPRGRILLSGPIRQGDALLGYMDLYDDRTVVIRDAADRPLP